MASDAKLVEHAFELRLSELSSSETAKSSNDGSSMTQAVGPQEILTAESSGGDQASGIDKSVLAVAAPRRYRNREHLRFVARQACLVCGRKPSDPHHLYTCSHGRSVVRPVMNSRCRSAESITAHFIARATSKHGGRSPASTRPKSPENFGNARVQMKVGSGPIG